MNIIKALCLGGLNGPRIALRERFIEEITRI
jgi:hypothetical protein